MKKSQTLYIKNPLAEAVIHALEDQIRAQKKPIDQKKIDAICAKLASISY